MMIPNKFKKNIQNTFKEKGKHWLKDLPKTLKSCEKRWSLKIAPPVPNLSYAYVAPATMCDGKQVILKIGIPNDVEIQSEITVLRLFSGHGICKLLEADDKIGASLLERLNPGNTLDSLGDDEKATEIAAELLLKLWRPADESTQLPSTDSWMQTAIDCLQQNPEPFPKTTLDRFISLSTSLMRETKESFVLHGDLHHSNILSATREPWLAIDPKGLIGPRAYDVGAFMRNPIPALFKEPNLKKTLLRRTAQFSEIVNIDRDTLRDWNFINTCLATHWRYRDQGEWQDWLNLSKLFE